MPPIPKREAAEFLAQRSPEWREFARGPNSWQWLLDSLEGGDRYRHAEYAKEAYPLRYAVDRESGDAVYDLTNRSGGSYRWVSETRSLPRRNLIRHRREYPTPERPDVGPDEFTSTDDEYELRLARTPVPGFVAEAVGIHLGRIYAREVRRDAPEGHPILEWWADVDGRGSTIDDWMQQTIAPILSVLGQLDLVFDHPEAPADQVVATRADVRRLGLGRCVAGYILPENLLWHRCLPSGRYAECLVAEGWSGGKPARIRHWTAEDSVLYDADGNTLEVTPHPFGRCPVVRVLDQPKARCPDVGQSRYAALAEIQREYYNVDSESVLTNTLQAHPLLSGPEDFVGGSSITVGPTYVLPMKKAATGDFYQGWEYVSAPSDSADRLMARKRELRDEADRTACLVKPPGASGATQATVAQSGVSKIMDEAKGNDWLVKQSGMLQRTEKVMVEMVLTVLSDGPPDPRAVEAVVIGYPREFNLRQPQETTDLVIQFQAVAASAGDLPLCEGHMMKTMVRQDLPGKPDEEYEEMDAEIDAYLADKAKQRADQREAGNALALMGATAGRNGNGAGSNGFGMAGPALGGPTNEDN